MRKLTRRRASVPMDRETSSGLWSGPGRTGSRQQADREFWGFAASSQRMLGREEDKSRTGNFQFGMRRRRSFRAIT
jgi:hypothetical protein